jgi:hypothetical protein
MAKYTLSLSVTYDLSGELLEDYKEWLEDYEDTEDAREDFLTDLFAPEDWKATLDPSATLTFTRDAVVDWRAKITGVDTECRCGGCVETDIYGKGMCHECFDQGCDETDYDGSNH